MDGNNLDAINRRMDEGSGMRFCLNKGTVSFVACMDLEDIRLSEISQAERHK